MQPADRVGPGIQVFLTVGCGLALQLLLVRQASMLIHAGAAFVVLAAHIGGWGLGLGVARGVGARLRRLAPAACVAAGVAWLGVALSTTAWVAEAEVGVLGFAGTAVASGALSGMAIAWALDACADPLVALAGDLAGVAAGALGHVVLASAVPDLPSPLLWCSALVLSHLRRSPLTAAIALLAAAPMLVPLQDPERLSFARNPLGRALREHGLEAWQGSFFDLDGRVDAVRNPVRGATELYINGGTQAQTPSSVEDRVTSALAAFLAPDSVLVLGAGGMADVATLLRHGAGRVVAVERSAAVLRAAREVEAARDVLEDRRVELVQAEARRFLANTTQHFDLLLLPLAYAAAGVAPTALAFYPSYLFTVEGLRAQAGAASERGVVCFILPLAELRDRILAEIGQVESQRGQLGTVADRLWIAQRPGRGAYAQLVCWAPHGPLERERPPPELTHLHLPGRPASPALRSRLAGEGVLPPTGDGRPYFFDIHAARSGFATLPPQVVPVLFSTPVALLLLAGLVRNARRSDAAGGVRSAELAIAGLTGLAFPATEYVALSIARVSGYGDGSGFALVAVAFALAGFVALSAPGSLHMRALVATSMMLGLALLSAQGALSWFFRLEAGTALVLGPAVLAALMTCAAAPFAGLFRAIRARGGGDVRRLFLASALGTLAGVGPVLLVELRWGATGCSLAAAAAYVVSFAVAAGATGTGGAQASACGTARIPRP